MYRLMIIQFLRNRFAVAALALLLAAGMVSIGVGKNFLHQQEATVAETTQQQQEKTDRLVKVNQDQMGLLLYYLKFAYVNPTSKLSALSIGQRDINSSIQFPTIRTLEAQKYDTDIQNPYRLLIGNFDLSFVFIFLFPLVIISLCFNLFSEEKERGTWPLIRSQKISTRKYLLTKLSVPFFFISGVYALLAVFAIITVGIAVDKNTLAFFLSNFLYIGFWFAIVLLVTSFFKSSSTNAISLLSAWIILVLLLPAAVNNYILGKYPVPESLRTMIRQRDGYHTKWDIPPDSTMAMFYKEYPAYASYKWTNKGLDWLWYYAMQHMGDVDARADRNLFMDKLASRQSLSKQISWFIPSIYTQLYGSELAKSSLGNHLQFLDNTTDFHERLRTYFYPKIFTASPVMEEHWEKHKPEFSQINTAASFAGSLYVGIFVVLISGLGIFRLTKSS